MRVGLEKITPHVGRASVIDPDIFEKGTLCRSDTTLAGYANRLQCETIRAYFPNDTVDNLLRKFTSNSRRIRSLGSE